MHVDNHHGYDMCIKTKYKDVTKNDIMVLRKVEDEQTIFEGTLLKEKIRVSVLIDNASFPDEMEVRFFCNREIL